MSEKEMREECPRSENIDNLLSAINLYRLPNETYLQTFSRVMDNLKLTLRDQFAMAAIPALIDRHGFTDSVSISYKIADAMMEER